MKQIKDTDKQKDMPRSLVERLNTVKTHILPKEIQILYYSHQNSRGVFTKIEKKKFKK